MDGAVGGSNQKCECDQLPTTVPSPDSGTRTVCIVPGCRHRYSPGISLHAFPDKTEKTRWKTWVQKLRLKHEPSKSSRVCSTHFSVSNFVTPTVNRITERMILKKSAIPDINLPSPPQRPEFKKLATDRADRAAKRDSNKTNVTFDESRRNAEMDEYDCLPDISHPPTSPPTAEAGVQVDTLDMDRLYIGRRRTMAIQFKTDAELNSWSGLNSFKMLDAIEEAIESLTTYKKQRNWTVNLKERILIVFVKLKTNLSFSCMAAIFHIHYQTVATIFYKTIRLIKTICVPLIPWPSQEQVKKNMPHYFRPLYEDVVAVLDCTEVAINKPKCLHCRINAFSHYKGKETVKYLVVVTPGGTISFISRGYGGKTSDKQVVIQERILEKVTVGEAVMTDKGFLIDDECRAKGIKLVRPPFLTAQTQLSKHDATENISIAAARVHVERAIQRIKQFDILNDKIESNFWPILDDIMIIACAVTNISRPILSNERF